MKTLNFNEIQIVDDTVDNTDLIRTVINSKEQEDAFYIADIGGIIKRHKLWISKMPNVIPHYAIKCNSNATVIKVLGAMNACFDCASKQEIEQVMQYGVQAERIIFAHPSKLPSHIRYAERVGVKQMTVDSEIELSKIKELFPEAKIIIRIRCDAKDTPVSLGLKFGCESHDDAVRLIQLTKDLGLNLYGFSFHVGTPCTEPDAYRRGIEKCKLLIDVAKAIGCEDTRLIDIGGGFTTEHEMEFDKLASIVNDAIRDLDPAIKVVSEPGRYYVDSHFTLAAYLHSKRTVRKNDEIRKMYHMNCGVYNAFFDELLGLQSRIPQLVFNPMSKEKFSSTIWGPTADSFDMIVKDMLLPELYIGDWLVWKDMGAYTLSLSNTFNGFPVPHVIPFIKRSQWEKFRAEIKEK